MLRVAVIADRPVARNGIADMLGRLNGVDVVAHFAEPDEFLANHQNVQAHFVILDSCREAGHLPAGTIEKLSELASVLIVSASRHAVEAILAAVGAGTPPVSVSAPTPQGEPEWAAFAGRRAGPTVRPVPDHLRVMPSDSATTPPTPALSPRESEALAYIACGYTHSQTALRMNVSKATVDTYIARVRAKLGIGNKAELALAALAHVQAGQIRSVTGYDRGASGGALGLAAASR